MKKIILLSLLLAMSGSLSAQRFAIKNNILGDVALSPNLGIEFGLGKKTTLDLYGSVNFWDLPHNRKWRHWLVQPEFRLWTCEKFNGSFFGLHLHGGELNIANLNFPFEMYPGLRENRYEGYFYGAGLSYGYQWVLGNRWNLELGIGGGWARFHYDRFGGEECAPKTGSGVKDYFGVTKLSLSFIYFIR